MASQSPRASEVLPIPGPLVELAASQTEGAVQRAERASSLALLRSIELPDRARHLWRYTDPSAFLPAATSDPLAPGTVRPWRLKGRRAGAVRLANGALAVLELDDAARRAGVTIEDLHETALAGQLGSAVPATHGFVEAISAATWRGGVVLRVPPDVVLDDPLRVRVVAPGRGGVSLPRVLVLAGRGSSFEVVESHVGGEERSLTLGVSEVLVDEAAQVRYALVQRWLPEAAGHLTLRARVGADAHFQLSLATFGGRLFKADVGAVLVGAGARAETYGVAMGGETQHFDHHTEHLHEAPHTFSNLDFRVALTESARSVYTGMIRIAENGAGSQAYQENRNVLLSPDARAESIPELEILTDDVRCSHGATVAPVDAEQVFYLTSRGLTPSHARRLIVYGFLDQTLRRFPDATRERIEGLIAERLHE